MTGHTLAAVIVGLVGATTFGIVAVTRSEPNRADSCIESVIWVRSRDGAMSDKTCPEDGHRIELHEHSMGAAFAVCRCPTAGREP